MLVRESISASRLERLSSRVFSGPFTCRQIYRVMFSVSWVQIPHLCHKHATMSMKCNISWRTTVYKVKTLLLGDHFSTIFTLWIRAFRFSFPLTPANPFESHTSIAEISPWERNARNKKSCAVWETTFIKCTIHLLLFIELGFTVPSSPCIIHHDVIHQHLKQIHTFLKCGVCTKSLPQILFRKFVITGIWNRFIYFRSSV